MCADTGIRSIRWAARRRRVRFKQAIRRWVAKMRGTPPRVVLRELLHLCLRNSPVAWLRFALGCVTRRAAERGGRAAVPAAAAAVGAERPAGGEGVRPAAVERERATNGLRPQQPRDRRQANHARQPVQVSSPSAQCSHKNIKIVTIVAKLLMGII